MHITQEELNKTQIPLQWRDFCAHLLPELNKCRQDNLYMPWTCHLERTAWQKCQYDDYRRRVLKAAKVEQQKLDDLKEAASNEIK